MVKYLAIILLLLGCTTSEPKKIEKGNKVNLILPEFDKMCERQEDNEVCEK